jgi:hypothetical protein
VNGTDPLNDLKDVNGDDCPPTSGELSEDEEWIFCEDCGGLDLSTGRCMGVSSHDLSQQFLSTLMQLEAENWRYKSCPCWDVDDSSYQSRGRPGPTDQEYAEKAAEWEMLQLRGYGPLL